MWSIICIVIGHMVIATDKAGYVIRTEYEDIFPLLSSLMKLRTQKMPTSTKCSVFVCETHTHITFQRVSKTSKSPEMKCNC